MRPLVCSIHLDALRHNLAVARRAAPQSRIMAVVKANGYGHGLLNVARGLAAADGFAVLGLNEALMLRAAGYSQTLLLLEGVFLADELQQAANQHISVVVHNEQQLQMLEQASLPAPVSVFIKLNTGMNRLGFSPARYAEAVARLQACPTVGGITLMTHFATADDDQGVEPAWTLFQQHTRQLTHARSLANSAALLRYPHTHADWVRPGIMLYGASPVTGTPAASLDLQAVMQLHSELIAVQTLQPGDSVGYGQRFTATRTTHIGIVACGYADGYPRHAPNGTPIAVSGTLTRTVGRVSMDMLFADITDIPQADIGSPVELWGKQVPVDAVAEASGTVGYELLCALAPRVHVKVVG